VAEVLYNFANASASLVAGANITLSSGSGNITVIGGVNTGATTFALGVSTDGNSAGTTGTVNLQAELVGGNNITLSESKNGQSATISFVGPTDAQSIGMSNIGNTAGTTGVVTGSNFRYLFAGGSNVTLSQSINGSLGTLTINVQQTTELLAATISGNTSGALAGISSGTLTLAGGNNITLSQAGNAVTISAFTESQSFGMSNLGNTDGTTGIASGSNMQFLLAGGRNITLSQSLNGSSGTITIDGMIPSELVMPVWTANASGSLTQFYAIGNHSHAGVPTAGVSSLGNTAGSTGVLPGNIVLVGGNHITLSMSTDASNGMTISIVGV
jgi:hypothetical protein